MKKVAFLSLFLSMMLVAVAQPQMPTLRTGQMAKGFDQYMAHEGMIASVAENEIVFVTNETRSILGSYGSKGLQVVATDSNLNVLRHVAIPDTRFGQLMAVNMVEGKVYILYWRLESVKVFRAVVEPRSMTLESNAALTEALPGFDLEQYHWPAKSPNGLFYALVGTMANKTSKETAPRQLLLDEKFELLWDKQYETYMATDISVNDDGVVYIFGSKYNGKTGETHLEVSILDVNDEKRIMARANVGEVFRLRMLNVVGNKVVAGGYIRTTKSPKNTDCFDKLVGMALNLETEELKTDVADFTSDELNVFGNLNTKKENTVGMVDNLVIAGRAATSFGGSLLLQREWKITTHSTKNPDMHDYYTMGALAFAVDTNGKIVWHKPFRSVCHEVTGQSWDLSCYLDAPMRAQGDDVYVFLSESSKTPQTYDIAQPAKSAKLQTQAHTTCIYGISRDGKVEKKVYELDEKATLVDVWKPLSENEFIYLCTNKKKSGLVYVNF